MCGRKAASLQHCVECEVNSAPVEAAHQMLPIGRCVEAVQALHERGCLWWHQLGRQKQLAPHQHYSFALSQLIIVRDHQMSSSRSAPLHVLVQQREYDEGQLALREERQEASLSALGHWKHE